MEQRSNTPMHSGYIHTPCYGNPPTEANSSSRRRSCYLFGVELIPTQPLEDNGNGKMLVNNAAPNAAIDTAKAVQFSEAFGIESRPSVIGDCSKFPSKGQQDIAVASGSNNARAMKIKADLFPEDAKDLLSTGIFDGIFVMYGGSLREEHKRQFAMIQGYSFLCACLSCNGKEYVSARKLEHHAGYETKHPNSGIYFGNGISIFKAVEILRKTPRDRLVEAIRTISGSRINEENFEKWKASYLASCSGYGVQEASTS